MTSFALPSALIDRHRESLCYPVTSLSLGTITITATRPAAQGQERGSELNGRRGRPVDPRTRPQRRRPNCAEPPLPSRDGLTECSLAPYLNSAETTEYTLDVSSIACMSSTQLYQEQWHT